MVGTPETDILRVYLYGESCEDIDIDIDIDIDMYDVRVYT